MAGSLGEHADLAAPVPVSEDTGLEGDLRRGRHSPVGRIVRRSEMDAVSSDPGPLVLPHVISLPNASSAMLPEPSHVPACFRFGCKPQRGRGVCRRKAAEVPCRWGRDDDSCSDGEIVSQVLHLVDQPLNGLAAPDLYTTPQRTQMAAAIKSRVTRLKFGEQFHSRKVRMRFQILKHMRPVIHEALRTGTASTRLVAEAAVL